MTASPPSPAGFPPSLVAEALGQALQVRGAGVPVFAISGLQGSGKSTLAAQLAARAAAQGLLVAVLSIDDFYLDAARRRALARQVHPLLATRGPPGTHDLALALDTLDALQAGRPTALPRFDKLADDRLPAAQWPRLARADLVVLEGWFLATPAQAEAELRAPLNRLELEEDPGGHWRRWCNAALARDYPALWARIDRLWFLQPPGFEVVAGWRWQQEQALQAATPGRRGMDRAQLERFVMHYERVSRQALRSLPGIADHVVRLDALRQPVPA